MRRLNNKGFAITGILYTTFIVFVMCLLSLLAGLRSKRMISEKYLSIIENNYHGQLFYPTFENINTTYQVAPVTGRYEFKFKRDNNILKINGVDLVCTSYINKGVAISNLKSLTYIPDSCNNYLSSYDVVLDKIYEFKRK